MITLANVRKHDLRFPGLAFVGLCIVIWDAVTGSTACHDGCAVVRGVAKANEMAFLAAGAAWWLAILFCHIAEKPDWLRLILLVGAVVEGGLIAFQVSLHTWCPTCLCFAALVGVANILSGRQHLLHALVLFVAAFVTTSMLGQGTPVQPPVDTMIQGLFQN